MNIKYINWKSVIKFATISHLILMSCTDNISENLGSKKIEEKIKQWELDITEYMDLANWGPCPSSIITQLIESGTDHFEMLKLFYYGNLSEINELIDKESNSTKRERLIKQKDSLLRLIKSTVNIIEEMKNGVAGDK